MIDIAGIRMEQGYSIACERKEGVNDNMDNSHYHSFYEIYYLESGERYHEIEDEAYLLKTGQLVIFPPFIKHRSYGDTDMLFKRIVIYFKKEELVSYAMSDKLSLSAGVYTMDNNTRFLVQQTMEKMLKESEDNSEFKDEYMKILLNMLVITVIRNSHSNPKTINKNRIELIMDYIHSHYNENLSLDVVSQKFFISPYHLCREFKKNTGRSIIKYINTTRIVNAKRQLMETDKTITQISNEVGFTNVTHFNRVFKEYEKMTPSEFRKTNNGNMVTNIKKVLN